MDKQSSFVKWLIPVALGAALVGVLTPSARSETIIISSNSNRTATLAGQSGGTVSTPDCGAIAPDPNHIMNVEGSIPSMQVIVEATGGQPTLLIDGPDGRFCASATNGTKAEISGLWPAGTYRIYVGDRSGGRHSYTLSLSR